MKCLCTIVWFLYSSSDVPQSTPKQTDVEPSTSYESGKLLGILWHVSYHFQRSQNEDGSKRYVFRCILLRKFSSRLAQCLNNLIVSSAYPKCTAKRKLNKANGNCFCKKVSRFRLYYNTMSQIPWRKYFPWMIITLWTSWSLRSGSWYRPCVVCHANFIRIQLVPTYEKLTILNQVVWFIIWCDNKYER